MNRTPRLSKSAIEYLDYAWNFESGCTKGCSYCYARDITVHYPQNYPNGFEPTLYPEAFCSPMRLKKPSIIGVGYMGDLFDDAIDPTLVARPVADSGATHSLRGRVFSTIENCPQHRFLFLTKQPQNLAKWSPFPSNCWVGVSATNMTMLADACYELKRVEAKLKYISLEPLLDYTRTKDLLAWNCTTALVEAGINWIILGSQTKPYIAPKVEWVREIVEAADKAGIPVFFKNSLKPLLADLEHLGYRTLSSLEWAPAISEHLRQEFPEGV